MPRIVLSDGALLEHGRAANLCELFLSLYRSVAENGVSEIVRKVFSSWESTEYSDWRNSSHPSCEAIANEIGNNPNDWIDDFSAMKDRLLGKLKELGGETEIRSDAMHHEVGCVVTALRELDVIVGQALSFPPGTLTYPSPPRSNGYTLVRQPGPGFYTR